MKVVSCQVAWPASKRESDREAVEAMSSNGIAACGALLGEAIEFGWGDEVVKPEGEQLRVVLIVDVLMYPDSVALNVKRGDL